MISLLHPKPGVAFHLCPGESALSQGSGAGHPVSWGCALCYPTKLPATVSHAYPTSLEQQTDSQTLHWGQIQTSPCLYHVFFPTHHIYNLFLLNNSKNHVTQRKVYKLTRLIFVVPFFKHLKALWFCDRCSFNNPMMGTGWMNGASFEIRSLAVTAEAMITHLFTTGVNSCYLRDSCISSQGPADWGSSAVLVFRDPGSPLSSGTEYFKVMLKSGGVRGGVLFLLQLLAVPWSPLSLPPSSFSAFSDDPTLQFNITH